MALSQKFDGLELPPSADFHAHLRDGAMMESVTKTVRQGGANTALIMPNLVPPITTVASALAYKARLEALDPKVNYLMTLYLHESITPEVVREAKAAGLVGIKSYPAGVTTNSSSGVISYEPFYPVFAEMEKCGLVLNLHGECPSDESKGINIMNAESRFLSTLKSINAAFPHLKIVLEHCTTAAAVAAVKECGPTVVGTITAHHLYLTIDDVADDPFNFCKPIAKLNTDRDALLQAAVGGNSKFFLGSDSAPHDISKKKGGRGKTAAGVFTQPYITQLVVDAFEKAIERGFIQEEAVTKELLVNFVSGFGRAFYEVPDNTGEVIILRRKGEVIKDAFFGEGVEVVPFRRGQETWSIEWK
ncbi:dihydroorotase [Phlyctema vagabunda]|uniref:dihydroorotase n=1 Tax=Phlyctema vagabunda TaxID=108571 RepID=A0ABR4P435_9HELO